MTKKMFRWAPAILALALIASPRGYAHGHDAREYDSQDGDVQDRDSHDHDGDEWHGHKKSVPEPATLTLIAVGLGGVAAIRRRRKVS